MRDTRVNYYTLGDLMSSHVVVSHEMFQMKWYRKCIKIVKRKELSSCMCEPEIIPAVKVLFYSLSPLRCTIESNPHPFLFR